MLAAQPILEPLGVVEGSVKESVQLAELDSVEHAEPDSVELADSDSVEPAEPDKQSILRLLTHLRSMQLRLLLPVLPGYKLSN